MKANSLIVALIFSAPVFAEEPKNSASINDLTSFKWGETSKAFFTNSPSKYEKPYQDKGAALYVSKDHIMIEDIPFKQIVKLYPEKGLTSINYMHISNKENFEATCKKVFDSISKSFSKPQYQAIDSKPVSSFYVWPQVKDTTMYEFCFSESALQTIIITVEPKWKIISCALDNSSQKSIYLFDEANNIIREYADNFISNALIANVGSNKIEFTSQRNVSDIVIDSKSMSYSIKNAEQKIEKGKCEIN